MIDPLETTMPIEKLDELVEKSLNEEEKKEEPKEKNVFKRMVNFWKKLPKKTKILVIIVTILVIILLSLLLIFLLKNKKTEEPIVEPPVPDVILEEENYRYENGKLIFISEDNEELGSYECTNQDENLCYVAYYDNQEDNFDTLKIVNKENKPWQTRTKIYLNNFVFIIDNSAKSTPTLKLYNIKTSQVENEYLLVKPVVNNQNAVILKDKSSKYGVIEFNDDSFKEMIGFTYDYLGSINENSSTNYVAISNKRNLLIDESGTILTKTIPGSIKNFNKKYLKVLKDDKEYIYDYNGKEIFSEGYDYVELYDNYAALINNRAMLLKTYEGLKLNENEIRLKNNSYVKKYTYDELGTLIESLESFSLTESQNIITIKITGEDEVKTINKLEGEFNKNLKYINYFDGVIYVYKDEAKTEALGSYICTNKNVITSDTKTLENCYFAHDTSYENNELTSKNSEGLIPIYNERYIFISDNPAGATGSDYTINLYDLKQRRILSRYMSVNTRANTNQEITFKTVNDYPIIAQNKSQEYGVINMYLSSVESYIPFEYISLEKIGNYYLAKTNEGYELITNKEHLNKPIPYKIMNYNDEYLTAIDSSNNYHVYDYEGNDITKDSIYTYINIYNNFYAAVKNNHLEIYTYDNPNQNIIANYDIPSLSLTNYYGKGTLAFKIKETGTKFTISIGKSNDLYEEIEEVFDIQELTKESEENPTPEVEE